jgi:hypothetical protein
VKRTIQYEFIIRKRNTSMKRKEKKKWLNEWIK